MSTKSEKIPMYMKYSKNAAQRWLDPANKLKPSDLTKPSLDIDPDMYPLITNFNNMMDNTVQFHSTVDIDQPIFEPAPRIVLFEDYEAFSVVRKKLYFRNKDSVGRRVKLIKPDTPFFEVSAPFGLNGEPLKQSKIASGMEVYFVITFTPQEVREYSWDLVCSTERENFLVPLRAIGLRPFLTLPDEIDFGACPIKSSTEKKIVVQNNGTSVAKFSLSSNMPEITVPEQDISIEAQASYQMSLQFVPHSTIDLAAEICVTFNTGLKAYINVKGFGKNVEVSLSTPSVTVEPSYISLFSQKTLKIRNLSDAPIRYKWKSFCTEQEEDEERERLLVEINRIEEEERSEWQDRVMDGHYDSLVIADEDVEEYGQDLENQDHDPTTNIPFAARIDDAIITRKYRNLRRALELDNMLFVDDIFEITPVEGEVWAHSDMEITVCFRPDTAAQYNCLAFLDVSGRHDRLSLQLMGQGIGPHAALSFEVLDVGDVFVNDVNQYELSIKNKGDIPAQWTFMSSLTRFGNKFQFSPTDGYLLPDQSQVIKVRFESDILGEFSEFFRIALQGNEDMLVCQIKGQVIGPTFHFDCNSIDFGTVSFDYLHSTTVRLVNTSKVPMVFNLHIPQDGTYLKKEFNIEPSHGTLASKEFVDVLIEFIPTTVKVYDYSLAVDVLGVGDILLSIPITAECIISTIKVDLPTRELEFGNVFIRYPYEQELKLINNSSVVHTKFEIQPQPKQTKSVASYEASPSVAVIEPSDSITIKVRLIGQKLGSYKVPVTIMIAGSQEPPMQAVLSFNTVGPRIEVGTTELKWGSIDCLKDSTRTLTINNTGLINANMKLFLKMARSCYSLEVRELVLEAQKSYDLAITANLDDSVVNKDEVHIMVDESDNLMVPLVAKGIGTTMFSKIPLDVLDLGTQLTNFKFEKQIVLENKGRRPQQLRWINKTVKLENVARLNKAKKYGKDVSRLPKSLMPMEASFTVTPEEITLRSRTATTFTFRGFSVNPRLLSEIFVLESKVGKERQMKPIMETEIRCDVVNPLLTFSTDEVSFLYVWERGVEASVQRKEITLTNSSTITLTFLLKTEVPFNLNTYEQVLQPGQKCDIIVEFDPTYRDDKESHFVQHMIQITYRGHPQKDFVKVGAEVVFPNLKFDMHAISFGCILNDTSKSIKLKLTNTCKIDVNYEWIFLEQGANRAKSRAAVFSTPPSNIFDILPVTSIIHPECDDYVDFTMLSTANMKLQGTVVCVVEGGPEYNFNINGESSNVGYELNRSVIDFAKVIFTDKAEQELTITNTGKVSFKFELYPTTIEDAKYLEFEPAKGKVTAGHNQKVVIRMRPGLPTFIKCNFTVQVAHFDPVQVECYCQGIFPSAVVALPRQKKLGPFGETENVSQDMWTAFQALIVQHIMYPDMSLLPPNEFPAPAADSTVAPPSYSSPIMPPIPPQDGEEGGVDDQQMSLAPAGSIASSTKGISALMMDVEMQRAALVHLLEEKLLTISSTPDTPALLQDVIAQHIPLKELIAGRYVCDFGNVIVGQTRKKIFKITNASQAGQLSWVFDKKYLSASGFSIEPEKVSKLAEGASVDFTVKFFARTQQKNGIKMNILPLELPGAPTLNIVFTANICVPEIDLSTSMLDFGKLNVGRSAKMFVGLKNTSPVAASWALKRIGKEEGRFTCEPSSGTLRPGKKVVVAVEFIPTEAKKCASEFVLKVDQNRKPKSVKFVGEGIGMPLSFTPTVVEINPVIPFSEGGEQIIAVTNSSDFPVEFFSVDFDTAFKEEEIMLTAVEIFDQAGLLRSKVRQPGDSLPDAVIVAYAPFTEAAKLAAEAASSVEGTTAAVDTDQVPVAEVKSSPRAESVNGDAKSVHSPRPVVEALSVAELRTKNGLRDDNLHQDIVIVGPPMSGVSTLAENLSRKLLLPIRTFEQMIIDVAGVDHTAGELARIFCGSSTADEIQARQLKEAELKEVAEKSKVDAVEAYKKEKKGKAKEIPEEVYHTSEVAAYNDFAKLYDRSAENLAKVISFRLQWNDFGDGAIYDGIYTTIVSPDILISALQIALPNAVYSSIIIDNGEEGFDQWIENIYHAKIALIERTKKAIELNKRALVKTLRPIKGKPLEEQVRELEALYSGYDVPEALPTGEESWVDQSTGEVIELETNDQKALDEKERVQYLKQIMFAQSVAVRLAELSLTKIAQYRKHANLLTISTPSAAAVDENDEGGNSPEVTPEVVVEGLAPVQPLNIGVTYEFYHKTITPILSTIRKGEVRSITVTVNPVVEDKVTQDVEEVNAETLIVTEEGYRSPRPEAELESSNEVKNDAPPLPVEGGLFEIFLSGEEVPESVLQLALAQLPAPKISLADKESVLPDMETFQIYRKPIIRPHRRAIKYFRIVDLSDELIKPKPVEVIAEPPPDPKAKGKPPAKAKAPIVEAPIVPVVIEAPKPPPTRWIVPAQGTIELKVRFVSEKEGTFESTLEFEAVGSGQRYSLPCKCICEYPKINIDVRNLFLRRLKAIPPAHPFPSKRFVLSDQFYSFGALSLFKKPEWKKLIQESSSQEDKDHYTAIEGTNSDVIRITNNGKYRCEVAFALEYEEDFPKDAFLIEPATIEIDEGETKEVRMWALPKEVREYQSILSISVSKNPTVTKFPLRCWGAEPTVDLIGPWTESLQQAEEALAKNTDKKQVKVLEANLAALKEAFLIDFDRVLLNKTEVRTYTVKSTSNIPVAWEIVPEDFVNSENIVFDPPYGIVHYKESIEIKVSFISPTPLMLAGKFSLKFADNEGGLSTARATVRKFQIAAESYAITAVTLNSIGNELSGSSELDFGLMRVGDYTVQTLKIGNKGKYRIGYSFHHMKPSIAELVTLEPMEGTIETGSALAEIKVTFCSKNGELALKSNADIMMHITEPLTGEIVENFPLLVTAQAKYNRFRLQPSKGISFGAMRFDAEARVKRAELRNESAFEITYVVCPAIAEHDELDDLDPAAFAAYAFAVPAATRTKELGEDYLKKAGGGNDPSGKGKKEAKPPVKGKGAVPEAVPSILNPLVRDPDNLALGVIPSNPLIVGAFTVHPRIATIQPGQAVSIDMKFDPSGCETVKEKLRICISGADPNDPLSQVIRTFEVSGESCLPALVTDDMLSIFEEQEVVSSLAESMADKTLGAGKLEKLPIGKVVYAESEKMLAFGPVICNQAGKGVVERLKISNPTKIDIKVKFKVLSPEAAAALAAKNEAGTASAKDAKVGKTKPDSAKSRKGGAEAPVELPQSFTVHPETWEIPPHEHRFVNVYFNPTEIKSYRSVFLAEIDDEGITSSVAPKVTNTGKRLSFALGGSGTLPCVALEQPTDRDPTGQVTMAFGKTLIEKKTRKVISLRNDGVMPATCLFELVGDQDFKFPAHGTSLTILPGNKADLPVTFAPLTVEANGDRNAQIRITVLNNSYGGFTVQMSANAYSCDAVFDAKPSMGDYAEEELEESGEESKTSGADRVNFPDINLSEGQARSQSTIMLRSRANHPLKFELSLAEETPNVITFSPSIGHLAPLGNREITVTFSTDKPLTLDANAMIKCSLKKMEYKLTSEDPTVRNAEESLWGKWDDAMKSIRTAYPEDIKAIEDYAAAMKDYTVKSEAEKAKGKKGKPVGPPPERCLLELAPVSEDGQQMVYEIVSEPFHEIIADYPVQQLSIACAGVADEASFECLCNGETLKFLPTFIFQSSIYKFQVVNKSKIQMPIKWVLENMAKRRTSPPQSSRAGTAATIRTQDAAVNMPNPYSIDPIECTIDRKGTKEFTLKFAPTDAGEFMYALRGYSFAKEGIRGISDTKPTINAMVYGQAKRPVCHFEIQETTDYLSRRQPNLKNELGLFSSIETPDLKIVEIESTGLKTRNTFRFYVTNTTNESYEFLWETIGEASPFWRCVQSAGMMFPGKRIEMIFEYLPEDTNVAEAFFVFKLPKNGLQQLFLFAGKVVEPKVSFTSSKVDFHSVMLGGEGITEVMHLENQEHLPFNFSFDKYSLMQLEGPNGPVLTINPFEGTVPPNSRIPITFFFKPQEEVVYNYNVVCNVKRKPNKLSINVKGEGYAVHPQIQLEQTVDVPVANTTTAEGGKAVTVQEKYLTLKPMPAVNIADFGSVQVLDSLAKSITVLNAGKYNFDYSWNIESIGTMLSLTGGKLNGTLLKGDELSYKLTFAPQREGALDGTSLRFTVAGKYVYQIIPRGLAAKPALRFSFMSHDFGHCFITSPGGNTVIEEKILLLKNHDLSSNISVECIFQKIRALWVDCPPSVIPPGGELEIPIRFAPREVKDYSFAVPFMVNGSSKVQLMISGSGIIARLELVNGSQRRTAFGLVNVGTAANRTVLIVNKSKRALPIKLMEGGEYGGTLSDRCISFTPSTEVTLAPRETLPIIMDFKPTKRVSQFNEDLLVQYAGLTRTLFTVSGKAQGIECQLDTDSIPYGVVVLDSQKVKKVTLENTGDLTITFQWQESTCGPHFKISPMSGKVLPGNEMVFDVIFKPKFIDDDIRQDKITLLVPGLEQSLSITCSGVCIVPPTENIKQLFFQSMARKNDIKTVKIANSTDKDWFLSPSLQGDNWKVPYEFKVPAKGSADLPVTYYPLTMTTAEKKHEGKLFIALPDGSAQLYDLQGTASNPECSGFLEIETPSKKAATVVLRVQNWLGEVQKLDVTMEILEKPTPATFVIAANATEVGPNGTKEFPVRFVCFTEGTSKARITFTNPVSGEYCFYEITAKTTMPEVLEIFSVEAPVRQPARVIITVENPLPLHIPLTMGSIAKPQEWWTCDNMKIIRVRELKPLSGQREGTFELEYRPMTVTGNPTEHLVTIITQELGTFKYKVIARATPPLLKQVLRFDAALGTMQTESFVFRAYNFPDQAAATVLTCAVQNNACFSVQKSLPMEKSTLLMDDAWDGEELRLPVQFEPVAIGEFRDVLKMTASDGGEYVCELIGRCTPPLPQGPFTVEQGTGAVEITFRNCFSIPTGWNITTDSPLFRITQPATFPVNVAAKTESKCSVVFEPREEDANTPGCVIAGKIFVTCVTKPEIPAWVYYLRGKINKNMPFGAQAAGKKK